MCCPALSPASAVRELVPPVPRRRAAPSQWWFIAALASATFRFAKFCYWLFRLKFSFITPYTTSAQVDDANDFGATGNNYSILNETEHDAKMFFAQGCVELKKGEGVAPSGDLPTEEE